MALNRTREVTRSIYTTAFNRTREVTESIYTMALIMTREATETSTQWRSIRQGREVI